MCTLCNVRVKNERLYRAHCLSAQHCAKLPEAAAAPSGPRRVVVFGDPIAHHSTLLPFREAAKKHPLSEPLERDSWHATGDNTSGIELEICNGRLRSDGTLDVEDLAQRVAAVHTAGAQALCVLTAVSNVTGASCDVAAVTQRLKQASAGACVVCWDYAASASHRPADSSIEILSDQGTEGAGIVSFALRYSGLYL